MLRHEQGETGESFATGFGTCVRTSVSWIARFALGSLKDLKDKPRTGRSPNSCALRRLGLSCQRSEVSAYQQDVEAVKVWKKRDYPKLAAPQESRTR